MKISKCIKQLEDIKVKFGDINIIGGYIRDDLALKRIVVVDYDGVEVYPTDHSGSTKREVDGVFFD